MPQGEWLPAYWAGCDKHYPPRGHPEWSEVIARTGQRMEPARYKPGLSLDEIQAVEMSFEETETAHFTRDVGFIWERKNVRFYYVVCDRIIGASRGEETNIVKVNRNQDGSVHGYPITESELLSELKKHNPEELQRYQQRVRQ